jgi:hypothetical protein
MGRPCFELCDPSVFEWIGYGALLLGAGALVAVAYLLARRLLARRQAERALVPIVVIAVAMVLAAIVIPRFPRPTFVPAGITAGMEAGGETDSFYLAGSYAVSWTLEPARDSSCRLEAALYRAADRVFIVQLVADTGALSGQTNDVEALAGARYFIDGKAECKWRVMLTPQTAPG